MFQDTPYTSPEWLLAIYIPPISEARLPFLHGRSCSSGLEVMNGVPFESITASIMRGVQIKSQELDSLKSETATDKQYLALSNIQDGIISLEGQYLSDNTENLEKYCIPNRAIVFSKIGVPSFKSAVVEIHGEQKIYATGNLYIIEIDETKANPYYIQAFLASEVGTASLKKIHSGSVAPTISVSELKKMMVPLPSLEEQNRITEKYLVAMDQVILLLRKLEKALHNMKHIYGEEE